MFIYIIKNIVYTKYGEYVKTFLTKTEAMIELGISKTLLNRCLNTDNHLTGDYLLKLK